MAAAHGARADLYGAQPERTALAWQRSLLGVLLGALMLTVTAVREDARVLAVLGAVLTAAMVWSLWASSPFREARAGKVSAPSAGLARLVLSVVSLAALGVALALSRVVGAA